VGDNQPKSVNSTQQKRGKIFRCKICQVIIRLFSEQFFLAKEQSLLCGRLG